jgi:arginine exporter protein ArgO
VSSEITNLITQARFMHSLSIEQDAVGCQNVIIGQGISRLNFNVCESSKLLMQVLQTFLSDGALIFQGRVVIMITSKRLQSIPMRSITKSYAHQHENLEPEQQT